jgi:plasmid maintenance system antidote protein VapI
VQKEGGMIAGMGYGTDYPNTDGSPPCKVSAAVMSNEPKTQPAEVFHVGAFIAEEMEARGWTSRDLAERMGGKGKEIDVNQLTIDLTLACALEKRPGVLLGRPTAEGLERAFGGSAKTWLRLDSMWQRWMDEDDPEISKLRVALHNRLEEVASLRQELAHAKAKVAQLEHQADRYRDNKKYHKAAKFRSDGAVVALCFKRPRAINLAHSLWTIRDAAVTCPKCLRILNRVKN